MDALWTGPMRRPSVQRFSSEVASASLWMFTGLILQAVVNSCKVGKYVPSALIFSVPFIISKNWGFTHLTLPVRIMEWTMGRFHLKRVFMYTVAHCFGYFFGLVLFHLMADALGTLPYVGCLSGHLSVQNALNVLPGVGILGEQVPTNAAGIACDTMSMLWYWEWRGRNSLLGLRASLGGGFHSHITAWSGHDYRTRDSNCK